MVKLLLEKGADINADSNGLTAIMAATMANRKDVAKILLEKGANANVKMSDGETCLMYALDDGREEIAKMLLEKGADVNDSQPARKRKAVVKRHKRRK